MISPPPYRPRDMKPCRDHLGRVFPSLSAMAAAWGLSPAALRQRLFRKWPLEKALTGLPGRRRVCCDHTGRKFPTAAAMARAWGLSPDCLRERLFRKWPLEKALTAPPIPHRVPVADPESGVICPSAADLARGCGIKPEVMLARIRRGATGAALVFPGDLRRVAARDHTGRGFPSLAAMAEAWGQPYKRFERRLALGWDIERALTAPRASGGRPKKQGGKMSFALENAITGRKPRPGGRRPPYAAIVRAVPCVDHTGKKFPSRAAMEKAWGLPPNMLTSRLAGGWPLEKALTVPPGASRSSPVTDHLGRVFPSFRELARAWGIHHDTLYGRLRRGYSLRRALTVPVRGRSE